MNYINLSARLLSVTILFSGLLFVTSCQQGGKSAGAQSTAADSINARAASTAGLKDTAPAATARNAAPPASPSLTSENLSVFIPPGYTAIDTTTGDLNLDPYPDKILALKKLGEDTAENPEEDYKRVLLILIGQNDHTYKLIARNDNAVLCAKCGGVMGDPYVDVVIKKGYFSIEHSGGSRDRWERTHTFKYSAADSTWYLYKDGEANWQADEDKPEKKKTKIYTEKDFGKVPFDKFDINK